MLYGSAPNCIPSFATVNFPRFGRKNYSGGKRCCNICYNFARHSSNGSLRSYRLAPVIIAAKDATDFITS